MARELKCSDLGFSCEAVVRGETDEEILQQAEKHGKETHGMSDTDFREKESTIRGAIRDAA